MMRRQVLIFAVEFFAYDFSGTISTHRSVVNGFVAFGVLAVEDMLPSVKAGTPAGRTRLTVLTVLTSCPIAKTLQKHLHTYICVLWTKPRSLHRGSTGFSKLKFAFFRFSVHELGLRSTDQIETETT